MMTGEELRDRPSRRASRSRLFVSMTALAWDCGLAGRDSTLVPSTLTL
jgi:hypothetical protein